MIFNIIFIFSIISSINILSQEVQEYIGKISIADKWAHRPVCAKRGLYKESSIIYFPFSSHRIMFFAPDYYPKEGQAIIGNFGSIITVIKFSDQIEQQNKRARSLIKPYYIMPQYMTNIDKKLEIFVYVTITLENNEPLFRESSNCYLPLYVFQSEANLGGFLYSEQEITLLKTFTDYKNEVVKCKFVLTLDKTFDEISDHYDEFLEDYKKNCCIRSKNCLTRLCKKIKTACSSYYQQLNQE